MSLSLDDRVALEVLVYRLSVAADARDADAYLQLYTADGVWDGMLGVFEGHARLRELIGVLAASEALRGTRHWPCNILVEGDSAAGTATVAHDNLLVQATDAGPRLHSMSRSQATAVKVDGTWRFDRRRITAHRAPDA